MNDVECKELPRENARELFSCHSGLPVWNSPCRLQQAYSFTTRSILNLASAAPSG